MATITYGRFPVYSRILDARRITQKGMATLNVKSLHFGFGLTMQEELPKRGWQHRKTLERLKTTIKLMQEELPKRGWQPLYLRISLVDHLD